jgi:hypothetical protein
MPQEKAQQPSLQDLMARFVAGQAGAHAAGLASFEPGEVMPYEAGPVQPIDAKLAWHEALAATAHYPSALDSAQTPAPPHWPQLVSSHEPVVALAFCVGNFPQLVRNFHQILQSTELSKLRPAGGRPVAVPVLVSWAHQSAAGKEFPAALLALGALRLAKQFEEADQLVAALDGAVPGTWRAAWDNEKAALAWHRGAYAEARELWRRQPASLPVRFNLAMADLFSGSAADAHAALTGVVAELPEASAWHHLARLYLTLAAMR